MLASVKEWKEFPPAPGERAFQIDWNLSSQRALDERGVAAQPHSFPPWPGGMKGYNRYGCSLDALAALAVGRRRTPLLAGGPMAEAGDHSPGRQPGEERSTTSARGAARPPKPPRAKRGVSLSELLSGLLFRSRYSPCPIGHLLPSEAGAAGWLAERRNGRFSAADCCRIALSRITVTLPWHCRPFPVYARRPVRRSEGGQNSVRLWLTVIPP